MFVISKIQYLKIHVHVENTIMYSVLCIHMYEHYTDIK